MCRIKLDLPPVGSVKSQASNPGLVSLALLGFLPVWRQTLSIRAGTIQSLSVHYRYRNQPIRVDTVIMLYDTSKNKISHLTFIQLSKRLKHIEFDLILELILSE